MLITKMLAILALLPAAALAQDSTQNTAIIVLILVAIIFVMAGLPLFRRHR